MDSWLTSFQSFNSQDLFCSLIFESPIGGDIVQEIYENQHMVKICFNVSMEYLKILLANSRRSHLLGAGFFPCKRALRVQRHPRFPGEMTPVYERFTPTHLRMIVCPFHLRNGNKLENLICVETFFPCDNDTWLQIENYRCHAIWLNILCENL